MTTTVLIVEHLIAGIQVVCWAMLIVVARFGTQWIDLELISGNASVIALLSLSFVYPLGVVCDAVADYIGKGWVTKMNRTIFEEASIPADTFAFEVITRAKNDFVASYFNYLRSRIRAARCLSFNIACSVLILIALWLGGRNVLGVNATTFWCLMLIMIFLIVITVLAWRGMCIQSAKRVVIAYRICLGENEKQARQALPVDQQSSQDSVAIASNSTSIAVEQSTAEPPNV